MNGVKNINKEKQERAEQIVTSMVTINQMTCKILGCQGSGCDINCQIAFAILAKKHYEAHHAISN